MDSFMYRIETASYEERFLTNLQSDRFPGEFDTTSNVSNQTAAVPLSLFSIFLFDWMK